MIKPTRTKPTRTAKGKTPSRPRAKLGAKSKACTTCAVVKRPSDFSLNRAATDGRSYSCRTCEAARVRRHELRTRYPACQALGVEDRPGALRDRAKAFGRASGFELEVASRLDVLGVDAQYEGVAIRYRDADGCDRRWTPDFCAASGAVIEAKGFVRLSAQHAIAAALEQRPDLDVRLVFQHPNNKGTVEGSLMTPAEWADALDLRWTTLEQLERVTIDLPRIRYTADGDRIVPGWNDDGQPALQVARLPEPH